MGRQRWLDLGRASSASGRRADRAPPFPPDAERRAFTAELSISPARGGPPAHQRMEEIDPNALRGPASFNFGKTNYSRRTFPAGGNSGAGLILPATRLMGMILRAEKTGRRSAVFEREATAWMERS